MKQQFKEQTEINWLYLYKALSGLVIIYLKKNEEFLTTEEIEHIRTLRNNIEKIIQNENPDTKKTTYTDMMKIAHKIIVKHISGLQDLIGNSVYRIDNTFNLIQGKKAEHQTDQHIEHNEKTPEWKKIIDNFELDSIENLIKENKIKDWLNGQVSDKEKPLHYAIEYYELWLFNYLQAVDENLILNFLLSKNGSGETLLSAIVSTYIEESRIVKNTFRLLLKIIKEITKKDKTVDRLLTIITSLIPFVNNEKFQLFVRYAAGAMIETCVWAELRD